MSGWWIQGGRAGAEGGTISGALFTDAAVMVAKVSGRRVDRVLSATQTQVRVQELFPQLWERPQPFGAWLLLQTVGSSCPIWDSSTRSSSEFPAGLAEVSVETVSQLQLPPDSPFPSKGAPPVSLLPPLSQHGLPGDADWALRQGAKA